MSNTFHISSSEDEPLRLHEESDEGQLPLDIFEDEVSIFVVAPIAGVDEENLEILVDNDLLTIRGSRPRPKSLPKNPQYFVEECFWGKFSRNVLLPSAVNSAEITAIFEGDIVIITIPKARKATAKIISLKKRT